MQNLGLRAREKAFLGQARLPVLLAWNMEELPTRQSLGKSFTKKSTVKKKTAWVFCNSSYAGTKELVQRHDHR